MSILKVEHLTKKFISGFWPFSRVREYTAVNDISFEIQKGEILGFLGPNGAGKTTTIQMLLGTLTPTSGMISYFGSNFAENRIECLRKIGYSSGYERLPARLTILENLDIVGRMYGLSGAERSAQIEKLLTTFGIWEKRHQETGGLSAGQATRVMLSKAFIANPEIVLLDEPTASLDPDVARDVRTFILEQCKKYGTTILITSHNMGEVTQLCDRVLVLKNGSIIANNTPEELTGASSNVRLNLTITDDLEHALQYLKQSEYCFDVSKNNVSVTLDEHQIADFLIKLSEQKIMYSHISIEKPTLEDYFLSIAKQKGTV